MNYFPDMEWNAKWDWDNLVSFSAKTSESLKMLQLDWGLADDGEIDAGSFDLSGIGGSSGGSGSDLGNVSSVKSSKSASTDSSPKEATRASSFTFEAIEGSTSAIVKKLVHASTDLSRTSSPLEPSGVSVEPVIGLKLGKRTYFENVTGSSIKSPAATVDPVASVATAKKSKSSSQNAPVPRCQVEGCNLDLSSAKDYHRKHRVCDSHSKCPKVTVKGLERRFCQQCSRFHSLPEFDEKKRSCRRRLADHNSRRRKPRQETIQFTSAKLSSSFYGGRQNMNFSMSNTGSAGNPTWESMSDSKFTITKYSPLKPDKVGQSPLPGARLSYPVAVHGNSSNELLSSKGGAANVFKQGLKEPIFSSSLDATQEFPCALSLLSTNSWGSSEAECISFDQPLHSNPAGSLPPLPVIPQGLPFASSEYWQVEHQSSAFPGGGGGGGQFPGVQLLKQHYNHGIY